MRQRQSVSIEKGPFNRYPTCHRLTESVEAGDDSAGCCRRNPSPFSGRAYQTRAALTHEAAHDSNEPSIALSGSPHRGAGPIRQSGWSPTGGRAKGRTSRLNVQSAEAGPSANLADGQVQGGYGACPKNETWRFSLLFSAHWPSATVR